MSLPWSEQVEQLSIHPGAATTAMVMRMARELLSRTLALRKIMAVVSDDASIHARPTLKMADRVMDIARDAMKEEP